MKKLMIGLLLLTIALLPTAGALAETARQSFGFNAANISGAPSGAAFLTGGGAYDPETGFVKAGGAFRCLADINQGPLSGCKAGQGVRWDAVSLLDSTAFKCTGAAGETLKTAVTDENTVVVLADFYRQGDGDEDSFTARIFVSAVDEASDLPGIQNVWIQGLGCDDANARLNP